MRIVELIRDALVPSPPFLPVDPLIPAPLHAVSTVRSSRRTNSLRTLNRVAAERIDSRIARVETIFGIQFRLLKLWVVLRRTHRAFPETRVFVVLGLWSVVLSTCLLIAPRPHAVRA